MTTQTAITETNGGVLLRIHVQPGARSERVAGLHGDRLKVAVTARPDRGAANAAVVDLLARLLSISASSLELKRGHTSRQKDLIAAGVTVEAAEKCLL